MASRPIKQSEAENDSGNTGAEAKKPLTAAQAKGKGKATGGAKGDYAKGDSYHHHDLREAMIQVAQQLVEAEGPGGWTVRAAARAAGVSSGAPYRHFADKEALLVAVAARGFQEMRETIERELAKAGEDPLMRFSALGTAYMSFALEKPGRYSIMFGRDVVHSENHPKLREGADETFATLVGEVTRAQERGLLRDDRDPHQIAVASWASMHGLADLLLSDRVPAAERDPAQLAGQVGMLLFDGLLRR